MEMYAYIPREDGSEPTGTEHRVIERNLKTVKGFVKRLKTFTGWANKPFRVYTFTNFYKQETFKLVYTNTAK